MATVIGGRYRQLEKIGAGGMQEVFVASDLSLGRRVAIKLPISASASRRFDRSARLSAKVVHPNVAATLDYVRGVDRDCLVEELVSGLNLQEKADRDFIAVDAHLAAHVLHHLSKGVAAAHRAGVVHRDLKPSNIIVSDDPNLTTVKITDFGIAKMADSVLAEELEEFERDSTTITGSKTLLGAIPYMAPESLLKPSSASFPSDIWALGAIGYWLLAGEAPFGVGIPAIARIVGPDEPQKPKWLGKVRALHELEDKLWTLIQRCLNRDAGERPSADILAAAVGDLCYSTNQRFEGLIDQVGIPNRPSNCFIEDGEHRVFFNSQNGYVGFGNAPRVGNRVSFNAFPGSPHSRAGLVLLLKQSDF